MSKKLISLITIAYVAAVAAAHAGQNESAAGQVINKVWEYYSTLNDDNWDGFMALHAVGSNGFWPDGMLDGFPTEASKEARKAWAAQGKKAGLDFDAWPKHIDVQMHSNDTLAVVTCYEEGTLRWPEMERERLLNRVSFIWQKTEAGWQVIHWHASKVTNPAGDE